MIYIILGIISILLLLLFIVILNIGSFVLKGGQRQTYEGAMKWQSDHYDTSYYDPLSKEDYEVAGVDDYKLHVRLLRCPAGSDRYVILTHGYTDNMIGSLKYAKMYLDMGYNCIIYDIRGHGKNDPFITTFGVLEAQDLKLLIEDTKERYKDLKVLGLHGESLGAGTSITCLKYKPSVNFVVSDCGFSDIENVLRNLYKNTNVPAFIFDLADLGGRIRYGYSLRKMRPIDSLDNNKIPVLFIHGDSDSFIVPQNSKDMKARTKGMTSLHLMKGSGHAMSMLDDPEGYGKIVKEFLARIPGI